jgi:hypothetical protein
MPDEGVGYGGACVVADDADGAFKRAENQTHNHWVHHHLTDANEQQWVRSLHAGIKRHTKALVEPAPEAPLSSMAGAALGAFAAALGSLLQATTRTHEPPTGRTRGGKVNVKDDLPPGDPGGGSPGGPSGAVGPSSSSLASHDGGNTAKPERPMGLPAVGQGEVTLDVWHGKGVLRIPVTVTRGIRAAGFELTVETHVMLDQGVEKDAPVGSAVPRVLAWLDAAGQEEAGAVDTRCWPEAEKWSGTVLIELVDDAAIEPFFSRKSIAPAVSA